MKRRKNFLFSGSKRFEVRIYPYGKEGYEAQGEQNIKRKKFGEMRDACRWFDAHDEYPLVEVVDLQKDHVVASGGTGRKFNPRKRKKPQMPKRRDVYAEMAKSRKTTRGHKRKDRKRSVAKGSSRKPKHKMRLNPFAYDKPNKEKGVFDANVKKRHGKLFGLYKGFYNALEEAGVEIEDLPPMTDLRDESMRAAVAIESTRFPELKGQSYETIPAAQAAKEALGIDEDGIFASYSRKYGSFLKTPLQSLTEEIKKNQATVKKVRGKTSTAVSTAKEDAEIKKLEAEMERRLQPQTYSSDSPVAAQEAQQASMYQRESASELLDDEEPLTPEQEEAFSKKRRSQSRARRISRYEQHVSDTRRTDVAPPLKVVADARQDVLLYALKDGTTQVWSKGSITETFLPSKKTPSVTFAHRYANWWRGLDGRGKIRDGAKKSRLRSRVLLAVEGKKGVKVIEPSVAQSLGHVQQDVIGTHGLPSLDTYELRGDRANPRRRGDSVYDGNKPERDHPYAKKLRSEGLTYSHSALLSQKHYGKARYYVYRLGDSDVYIAYFNVDGPGRKWLWKELGRDGKLHSFDHSKRGLESLRQYIKYMDTYELKGDRANPRSRKKESKRAFVDRVWSERAPRMPSHSYGPRKGLEGPFQFRSGKVLYYDPREGAYYDPDSDMYLSDSEAEAFIMNPRRKNPKFGVGDRVKLSATALRLFKGRDYKDSRGKPYDKSYVGFIKHIEGNGYWVRRPGRPHTDLDYFREVDLVAAGSSPKRRKNSSGLKFQIDGHGADYPFRFKKGKIGKVGRLELSVIPINTFYPLLADSVPSVREMNAYILVVRADGSGKDVPYATRMKVLKAAQQAVADYAGLPI